MLRVVFMGTPEFALPTLQMLWRTQEVVGVFTRPDQPAGRGLRVTMSPVKEEAVRRGAPLFEPQSLRTPAVLESLRDLRPEIIVVAAYGLILPQAVLALPAHGCLNIHASLLPKYRGASPVASAILSGDLETGVTVMLMDAGLDTGPVVAQRALRIDEQDDTASLEAKLSLLGADLLSETITEWTDGRIQPQPQDSQLASMTHPIRKEDGWLDWTQPAEVLARRVRAFNPWPGAHTTWQEKPLKVLSAAADETAISPGRIVESGGVIRVGCGVGSIRLERVQPAGKRAMTARELARGHRDFIGAQLGAQPCVG
ncbi:MAG: methionyl-tRNA formyltransferase [Chloroflexi bacterium]|nr:methionyl-tRNA formyltransferase [Chloroflexota bacterium]